MSSITKVCTLALIGIVLLFVGCGGSSNPNPNNLTQPQAQQLGTETFTSAFGAVEDVVGQIPMNSSRKSNLLAVLPKNKNISSALTPEDVSCSGSTCTITSVVYDCVPGGTITINGRASESSSSFSLNLTLTPANCSDGTLVINGNPDITFNLQGTDDGTTTTVNASIGGDVSFLPVTTGAFPTGSCGSSLLISASVTDSTQTLASCSISGKMCGLGIPNSSCLPPD